MEALFQNVLTASFHGSVVIVAVLILRRLLKGTPKKFLCLLWLLAGIRLLMPFEIRSDLSLQPQVEALPYVAELRQEQPEPAASEAQPQTVPMATAPAASAVQSVPAVVLGEAPDALAEIAEPEVPAESEKHHGPPDARTLVWWVWISVACCFGVYTAFAYVALRVQVRDAVKIPEGWESDRIDTAFILGFIRPQIYIPMGMSGEVRRHILAHERTHLEKGDHWFKMIGFIALAIHWFNPLVWVAYILLCKDIEMACDERVVQFMDLEERKHYSAALLSCSTGKTHFSACPVAFGEVSVKERIKSVLKYRKPGFWISLLGVIAIIFVAVCLVTSPAQENTPTADAAETEPVFHSVTVKNPDEFLAAIAPNTEILMEPGTYILSESTGYGTTEGEYYKWVNTYDGWQLTVTDVENLAIRGSGNLVTVIETDPRYSEVLAFENCSNVTLEDFTAGHTRERGVCGGGVIELNICENVAMSRLGLYGCGVIGLSVNSCADVILQESDIYECSNSAVWLEQSENVKVSNCRIYDIGHDEYGGYAFFSIGRSTGVVIDNNHMSDSSLNYLISTESSMVELTNNLFSGNRPQAAAFSGAEVSITMDGNRFEGNSIRSWYSNEVTAKNKTGKRLTQEQLHEMYGTDPEPTEPKEPQLEIHVSTVDEFLSAIGSNRDIVLDSELYDLSTATGYGSSGGEHYRWEDIFDGPGLIITGVSNMTIRTATGDRSKHTVSAVPRYADVLSFRACDNITLSGFTAGHTLEPGSCAGGVLEFSDCDAMTVEGCGLFGCGILGVQADYCSDITVKNTEIYECSQGGINMRDVDGITIENVSFRDIGGNDIIYMSRCKNAAIDGKQVIGSTAGGYRESTQEQEDTFALQAAVNDFANSYLNNEWEFMQTYLAKGYVPEPWVSEYEYNNLSWFEITYAHVQAIREAGKLVFEVPFKEWSGEWVDENDTKYLLITVIEENAAFKVSGCEVKE